MLPGDCDSEVVIFGWNEWFERLHIDGLVQGCGISIANAMHILQSDT